MRQGEMGTVGRLRAVVTRLPLAVLLAALSSHGHTPPAVEFAPPHEEPSQLPYRKAPHQTIGATTSLARRWVRDSYVSIQVNVDDDGSNIVGDAANEPSIAVDPTDPARIVIGWRQFDSVESDFRQAGWAYSQNGGETWHFPGVLDPGVRRSDPVLAADADGDFYFYSLHAVAGEYTCQLFKSTDSGLTWRMTGDVHYGGDKPWMAIDRTGGLGRGHIYCAWDNWGCCGDNTFTRSVDGGQTFDAPISMPGNPIFGVTTVGPNGEVYVAGQYNLINSRFVVAKSSTARNPATPVEFDFGVEIDLGGRLIRNVSGSPNPGGLLGQVWIACDHSSGPGRGNVYVLGSLAPIDPLIIDPLDIHFVRSTDGGLTWSRPIRINDDPKDNHAWQWFAALSVAPNGRIDVIWNDTRNDPSAAHSELYYAFSSDGGLTWSENIPVSPPFDHSLGYPNQNKLGDYYDLVSDNAGVRVAYAATFNGEQDIYFLRIIAQDCNNNGVADADDIAGGTSDDCNSNNIPDECELSEDDCNGNNMLDMCDIASGTSQDCQPNGQPDECDLGSGTSDDCDANTVPDECELSGRDCDGDGILDICELVGQDCNTNGVLDGCDIAAGTSVDCQPSGVPDECELTDNDCNTNGIPDECELPENDCNDSGLVDTCDIAAGTSLDCQPNSIPDECELEEDDCNGNGIPDACDVAVGTSADCQPNGIPDECELIDNDCNTNGIPDDCELSGNDCNHNESLDTCDISLGTSVDCQANSVPDECELQGNDCNVNGVPDECELSYWDCNDNGVPDDCDIARGESDDCQGNGVPDECELRGNDCNTNEVPDECELNGHDCNGNLVLDECDVAAGTSDDCNTDGIPDECELTGADCNGNEVIDACDIIAGTSGDCQSNGIPDECELAGNDCNSNRVPDECELQSNDCNGNGIPDECELAGQDCNANGMLDMCDLSTGVSQDCQENTVPDECELMGNDCNGNGMPDECELGEQDCNDNGLLDECELAGHDCNRNTLLDECDIASGRSEDQDGNGVPDICERPPCYVSEARKLSALGGADADYFGYCVSTTQDIAVVGARGDDDNGTDSGSAYVLRFDGADWAQQARLLPSDGAGGDRFGWSIGVSGSACVAGAYRDDDNGNDSGSAYIFRFDGVTWGEEAKLLPSDGRRDDNFGCGVSIQGDIAIVGAQGHASNDRNSGAAYIFRFDGSRWIEDRTLVGSDTEGGDHFGAAVSMSGTTAVVGAYGEDERGSAAGAAYVFCYDGSDWVEDAKLMASDGSAGDWFGYAVAVSGDTVVVGAHNADANGNNSGAAYVFRLSDSGWVEEQKLTASNGGPLDVFGQSVAVFEDTVLVGAPKNDGLLNNFGSGYVFGFDGAGWIEQAALIVPGNASDDKFGFAVALFEGTGVIGAYYADDDNGRSGAVYVFEGLSDCNGNAAADVCDIADGVSTDRNGNSVPDECEALQPGDFDGDGDLDLNDYRAFKQCTAGPSNGWGSLEKTVSDCLAVFDFDVDLDVDLHDFSRLQTEWNP